MRLFYPSWLKQNLVLALANKMAPSREGKRSRQLNSFMPTTMLVYSDLAKACKQTIEHDLNALLCMVDGANIQPLDSYECTLYFRRHSELRSAVSLWEQINVT